MIAKIRIESSKNYFNIIVIYLIVVTENFDISLKSIIIIIIIIDEDNKKNIMTILIMALIIILIRPFRNTNI
jgi:hypothetical protein